MLNIYKETGFFLNLDLSGMMGMAKKKNIPKPSNPLKSFNWSKLPDMQLQGTIWTELDDMKVMKYFW